MSRTIAIGDIHGCKAALDIVLTKLAIQQDDTLVVLGDAVDRGPDTRGVVERLLELREQCRLVFLLGNHEEMMLEWLDAEKPESFWLAVGGQEAVDSYGGPNKIPAEHIDFLRSGLDYWESDTEVFVHACLEPGVPLGEQKPEWLRWSRVTALEEPLESGKRVICGHTPQVTGEPLIYPGWMCIDTLVYGHGYLTAVDLGSGRFYQANQAGVLRTGTADDSGLFLVD